MNASDMRPAVIIAIEVPLKGAGTFAAAIRSRIAANNISTNEKPTAAPKPYTALSIKLCFSLIFNNATPRTAQLVVMSGKKYLTNDKG